MLIMEILRTNSRMLSLARGEGFKEDFADEDMVRVSRVLT
jgi:hypothetical protein